VAAIFATRDRAEWLRDLAGLDTCVEPVLSATEAWLDEQAAGLRLDQPDGAGGVVRTMASPFGAAGLPVSAARPAPALGEHTAEVLAELGYAHEEIERMAGRA
jgi:crotonobetainyl-CoA:carnitine CoA-transferase CaiB-like acyl-CoA transferase